MKSQDEFKMRIYKGDIPIPRDSVGLVSLLDRYLSISKIGHYPDGEIEGFKFAILQAQKYKAAKCGGAYISAIKQAVSTQGNSELNEIVTAWLGIDLMTHALQRLVVEGEIKIKGKRVYLKNS